MRKKVYLDCTFTVQSGMNTGIQRVVRNIAARHELAYREYDMIFQPVVSILGRYYEVPLEDVLVVRPTIAGVGQKGKNLIADLRGKFKSLFGEWKLLTTSFDVFEWGLRKMFSLVKYLRLLVVAFKMRKRRAIFEEGSIFVLLDVFWTYDIEKSFRNSNRGVGKVISVIYDLIPILHPQFVEEVNCRNFSNSFPKLAGLINEFICISQAVADDMRKILLEKDFREKKVSYFRLGCDFKATPKEDDPFSQSLVPIFDEHKVWLTVGTIEPRKNHGFILDAFEKMWVQGYEDRLVIVGRIGWMCEEILSRIAQHPDLNKRLFYLNSASDADLMYCYKHSRGLVFASFVEGFGLPLVEAMQMKLRVLCSDIPVFREVGGDYPFYFSLNSVDSLVRLLQQEKQSQKDYPEWPSWDQSVREFLSCF